ncbi:hypothetical protein PFISCL1PPCAC_24008 [Pristionchus fissidentatus]|uniref:Methyltransferase n=1 Tax=Pristionchus fissidentatus TaxID=1538716 RepID=A0AAV5WL79_9BILA|nr:hypothetical protein PFISCL1PPCAC_24008 [Pristionchus fissidentatus]
MDVVIKSCLLLLTFPLLIFIIYDSSANLLRQNPSTYSTMEDGCGTERLTWAQFLRELFFMGISEKKEWGKSKAFDVPFHRVDTLDFVLKELKDIDEQRPPRILQLDAGVGEETVALSLQCRELRRIGCDIVATGDWMKIGPRGITIDTFRHFSMSLTRHHAWEGVFPWRTNTDYIIDQLMCNLIKLDVLYLTDMSIDRLELNLNRFLPYIRQCGFVVGGYAAGVDEIIRNFTSTHKFSMLRKVGSWAMRIRN